MSARPLVMLIELDFVARNKQHELTELEKLKT